MYESGAWCCGWSMTGQTPAARRYKSNRAGVWPRVMSAAKRTQNGEGMGIYLPPVAFLFFLHPLGAHLSPPCIFEKSPSLRNRTSKSRPFFSQRPGGYSTVSTLGAQTRRSFQGVYLLPPITPRHNQQKVKGRKEMYLTFFRCAYSTTNRSADPDGTDETHPRVTDYLMSNSVRNYGTTTEHRRTNSRAPARASMLRRSATQPLKPTIHKCIPVHTCRGTQSMYCGTCFYFIHTHHAHIGYILHVYAWFSPHACMHAFPFLDNAALLILQTECAPCLSVL